MICKQCSQRPARRGSEICGTCLRELADTFAEALAPLAVEKLEDEPEMAGVHVAGEPESAMEQDRR